MESEQANIGHNMLDDQVQLSFKMDRMYINALHFVRSSSIISLVLEWAKACYLIAIVAWYFSSNDIRNNDFFAGLVTAASLSVVVGFVFLILINMTKNLSKNLIIAKELDHLVEEPYNPGLRFNVFQDWISNVYNARDPENSHQEIEAEKVVGDIIKHYYFVVNKDLNVVYKFSEMALFGIAIWMAVELGTNEVNSTFKIFVILYLIFQLLLHWRLVLVCLVIVLSPLLCVLICVVTLCCQPKKKDDFIKKLQPINYRDSVHLQHGVECLICFTNFYPDEKICILECPAKHAYHQICIRAWFQVGSTCPVCRYDFSKN